MGNLVLRQKDNGGYDLFGAFSNRWRDWDFHADPEHGGEIVAKAAHQEFEAWLDANPQHALELWTWHTPGSARKSRANWWAFSDNFFYVNWPLTREEGEALAQYDAKLQAQGDRLGMSFGFYVLGYDWEAAAITKYRAFEASTLPVSFAANKWTTAGLSTQFALPAVLNKGEQEMAMSRKKLDALVELHGAEFAAEVVAGDAQVAELLDAAGVASKDNVGTGDANGILPATADEVAAAPVADDEPPAAAPTEDVLLEEVKMVTALEKLQGSVLADMAALAARQEELAEQLKAVLAANQELAEINRQLGERLQAEEKTAAAPVSVLASWLPKSLFEQPAEAVKEAQADGRSTLVRNAGPGAQRTSGGDALDRIFGAF
jgi:hypothetical protein